MSESDFRLIPLSTTDGSWARLCAEWTVECEANDEEFESFAPASLLVIESLAQNPKKDAIIFGLVDSNGRIHAVLQANSTYLPGYEGKVLRIRHLLVSPAYDFGDFSVDDYSRIMGKAFNLVVKLSESVLPSRHIKMHLRSPSDVRIFHDVSEFLNDTGLFASVKLRGAWLYLSLKA